MRNLTLVAGLAAGIALGLPAIGQQAAAQSQPAAPSAGAAQQPPPKQTKNGDWVVSCAQAQNGTELCEMGQVVSINKGDERVPFMQLLVGHLPQDRQARLRVMAPLGVLLQQGATLQVDQGSTDRIPFAVCTREGCIGELAMNNDLIGRMKRGAKGTMSVTMVNGQKFDVPFSLAGFTKSFDTVMQ